MNLGHADIAVVGAGAAGLFASVFAGRALRRRGARGRVVAVDGAARLGAKILVAGGGRCNVTHHAVDESAYAGSSRHAIKKVLRSFGVEQTRAFFAELGVELKREETGKLFPVSDDAQTVLDALLRACREAGVELVHPWRVAGARRSEAGFECMSVHGHTLQSRALVLATGGMALPKSGSDGAGYGFARSLGHTVTPRVFPALVPLTVAEGCFLRGLSGIALPAELTVATPGGKAVKTMSGSTLLTHFGLSGPGPLDISRYYLDQRQDDPQTRLLINFLPGADTDRFDAHLVQRRGDSLLRTLTGPPCSLPERLARALCAHSGTDPTTTGENLTRQSRRALAVAATALDVPVTGSRGFTPAEVTAGGVPLAELKLDTMASRVCPGLFICGELCDVDGRIGGFNFQWAWASGHLAGIGAAEMVAEAVTGRTPDRVS